MMCSRIGAPAAVPAAAPAPAAQAQQPQQPAAPTGLAAAQTFDEIADHMQTKHGITVAPGLKRSISADALRTACEGIEAVIDEFPVVAQYIRSLSGGARGRQIAAVNPDGDIIINTSTYKTQSSLDATVLHNVNTHYHPQGSGAKEFTSHEVGHLLNWILIKAAVRSQAAAQVAAGGAAPSAHQISSAEMADWRHDYTATKLIDKAVKNITKKANRAGVQPATRDQLRQSVSGYAMDNDGETLAECVADYVANRGQAKRLSREVWRLLKKDLT